MLKTRPMAITFVKNSRAILIDGFAGEPDPNSVPPSDAQIFHMNNRNSDGDETSGHVLVGKFDTEEVTGSAAFQTWFRDAGVGDWYRFTPDVLTHRLAKVTLGTRGADFFVQVLSLANVGAANKFTLSMSEL